MFRAASEGPQKMITANRLGDGLVVFLDPAGGWTREIAAARLLPNGPELAEAEAYAKAQHDARVVVEPYAIDVDCSGEAPVPVRLRERIRAEGPTVDYGHDEIARLSGAGAPGLAAAE